MYTGNDYASLFFYFGEKMNRELRPPESKKSQISVSACVGQGNTDFENEKRMYGVLHSVFYPNTALNTDSFGSFDGFKERNLSISAPRVIKY